MIENVYGGVPPLGTTVKLYGRLISPFGSEPPSPSGPLMTIE